jgi:hypothetical protein
MYPEDIFPADSDTPDARGAQMARLTCDNVRREIDEEVDGFLESTGR